MSGSSCIEVLERSRYLKWIKFPINVCNLLIPQQLRSSTLKYMKSVGEKEGTSPEPTPGDNKSKVLRRFAVSKAGGIIDD